jgi:ketosteroid isomerase-like protein
MSALEVLCAAYSAWSDEDVPALLDLIADDVVFAVNVPLNLKSYVGKGIGKPRFETGLRRLLAEWEVVEYTPLWFKQYGLWQRVHVAYCYRERRTGLEIESTMRHHWRVVGDEIVQLEVHFDSPRMNAFRRLAQAEPRV